MQNEAGQICTSVDTRFATYCCFKRWLSIECVRIAIAPRKRALSPQPLPSTSTSQTVPSVPARVEAPETLPLSASHSELPELSQKDITRLTYLDALCGELSSSAVLLADEKQANFCLLMRGVRPGSTTTNIDLVIVNLIVV